MKADIELLFDADIHHRIMREIVPRAHRSVVIATALAKHSTVRLPDGPALPVLELLRRNSEHGGVETFLLTAGKPSRRFLEELRKAGSGVRLRVCARNHIKAVLVDGEHLYLGSANLTDAGLGAQAANKRNFEFGIYTREQAIIRPIERAIRAIWDGRHCERCQRKRLCQSENEKVQSALQTPPK